MNNLISRSIFDNDLYKFTMQQAVLHHYPHVRTSSVFNNRRPEGKFTQKFADALRDQINGMADLQASQKELEWLEMACPFFKPSYHSYLETYRFNPSSTVTLIGRGTLMISEKR